MSKSDSPGVSGAVEAGDRFGASLSQAQPSTSTRPTALAVGVPGEDVGSATDAGMAHLLDQGLGEIIAITQDSPGVAGAAETGDRFGAVVTLGRRHRFRCPAGRRRPC